MTVGKTQQSLDVLVDNQDRLALLFKSLEALPDLRPDFRRETFRCLVKDQEFWIGHQRASDRQHLLFAPGQFIAHVVAPLGERGEKVIDAVQGPSFSPRACRSCGDEIFLDRQRRKDLTAFWHEPQSRLGDTKRRQTYKGEPVERGFAILGGQ